MNIPPTEYKESPRFNFQDPDDAKRGLEFFERNGYVVAQALTPEEVDAAKGLFWDFIEGIPDRVEQKYPGFKEECKAKVNVEGCDWISRNDIRTWNSKAWPGDKGNGIINSWGANHSPFAWFVRSRPVIKEVFAQIWEDDNLLVSFDAINAFRPWAHDPSWRTDGGWYHVDQNAVEKPDKCCIQGLVSLKDTTKATGGLVVIPGSHKHFNEIGKKVRMPGKFDFVMMPKSLQVVQETPGRLVTCKAGDLCLWDSRTIHCNTPGVVDSPAAAIDRNATDDVKGSGTDIQDTETSADANEQSSSNSETPTELLRIVSYVCMTPASMAGFGVVAKREEAIKKTQGTNHWPHEFHVSGPEMPPFADNEYIDASLVGGNSRCTIV